MSGIPNEIPDFGSVATVPRPNPEFVPPSTFSTIEYYVLSRCDGRASLKEILLMLGGVSEAIEVLCRLRRAGALLIEGEPDPQGAEDALDPQAAGGRESNNDPPDDPADAVPRARPSTSSDYSAPFATVKLLELSADEEAAMAESVDLDDDTKERIIAARRNLSNYFELLEVEPGVDKRELKRAYFRFSKHFHPDRYYGQRLGVFGEWLSEIFKAATKAFNVLSDARQGQLYEARLFGRKRDPIAQTREEHAAELFRSACEAEISGDLEQALQLFAAACRSHSRPAYVSRAARCALRAANANNRDAATLRLAEDYAKKAAGLRPKDPSYARLLADVYRAAGRLDDAETALLHAINLNSENDVLMTELRQDLEKLRRDRPSGGQRSHR